MMRVLFLIAGLGFVSACSHVQIQIPVARIVPPEMMKKSALDVGLHYQASRLHEASGDASARPPTLENTDTTSSILAADLSYAPLDRLQVGAGMTSDVGFFASLEYQFLGTPWSEKKQGWSAAVHLDGHTSTTSRQGDQNGEFGPGGYNWKASLTMNAVGGGLSAGYRFNENFMTFIGASKLNHTAKFNVTQDPSDNGTDPGGEYSQSLNGSSSSVGLGIVFSYSNLRIIPVGQWVEYELDGKRMSQAVGNISLVVGGM